MRSPCRISSLVQLALLEIELHQFLVIDGNVLDQGVVQLFRALLEFVRYVRHDRPPAARREGQLLHQQHVDDAARVGPRKLDYRRICTEALPDPFHEPVHVGLLPVNLVEHEHGRPLGTRRVAPGQLRAHPRSPPSHSSRRPAASATFMAAATSPIKSGYPGVSIMLILVLLRTACKSEQKMDICRSFSLGW